MRPEAPEVDHAEPLSPMGASSAGIVLRRLISHLRSTPVLRGSETGQRVRQAVGASMHLTESARFLGGSLVVPGRPGTYTVPPHTATGQPVRVVLRHRSDDVVSFNEIFHHRIYRFPPRTAELLKRSAIPRIIDLGANVGLFSVWVTAELPGATVTALEPDPVNYEYLRRQLAANRLGSRVAPIRAAAGNASGVVSFAASGNIHSSVVPAGTTGAIEVDRQDVLPLIAGADLVKMDIEGSEWSILADPRFRQAGIGALVLEWHATAEHPEGQAATDARALLDAAGFVVEATRTDEPNCGVLWAVSAERGPRLQ